MQAVRCESEDRLVYKQVITTSSQTQPGQFNALNQDALREKEDK